MRFLYLLFYLVLSVSTVFSQEITLEKQWDGQIWYWDQTNLIDLKIHDQKAYVLLFHFHIHWAIYYYTLEVFDVKNVTPSDDDFSNEDVNIPLIKRWRLDYITGDLPPTYLAEALTGKIVLENSHLYLPDVSGAAYQFDLNGNQLDYIENYKQTAQITIHDQPVTFPLQLQNDIYLEEIKLKDSVILYNKEQFSVFNQDELNMYGEQAEKSSNSIYYNEDIRQLPYRIFKFSKNMFVHYDPELRRVVMLNADNIQSLETVPLRFEPSSENYEILPGQSIRLDFEINFSFTQTSNNFLYQIESNKNSMLIYLACYKILGLETESVVDWDTWQLYE